MRTPKKAGNHSQRHASGHPYRAKIRKLFRRTGIFWEYDGDGRFPTERIPTYWRRWMRRLGKDELRHPDE
jgi:hypothetical protein